MNKSIDDKFLCIVASCEEPIEITRLYYYMYLFQLGNYGFKFRFKLNSQGIYSRGLASYISELIDNYKIIDDNGVVSASEESIFEVSNFIMSYNDILSINKAIEILSNLSYDELVFVTMTAMVVSEVKNKYGADGLVLSNGIIPTTLSQLTNNYSEKNLSFAIRVIKVIEEG